MATYPNEAYNPVTDFYKTIPEGLKGKANDILTNFAKEYKEGEAPPDKMLASLESLVANEGSLKSIAKETVRHSVASGIIQRISEPIHKIFKTIYDPFGWLYPTK